MRSATSTRATTTSRPPATTPSGGSTSARSASRRCSASSASCSAPSSTPASTARSRSAPAPAISASTCCRPGSSREATCTDISPGMVTTLSANAERLGLERQGRAGRRRVAAVRRRELRPRARPRGAAPPARPATARSPSFTACCGPGGRIVFAGEPSRIGDRIARAPEARRGPGRARSGARCCARRRRRRRPPRVAHEQVDHEPRAVRRHPRLRARPTCSDTRAGPASPTSRSAARS